MLYRYCPECGDKLHVGWATTEETQLFCPTAQGISPKKSMFPHFTELVAIQLVDDDDLPEPGTPFISDLMQEDLDLNEMCRIVQGGGRDDL